MAEGKKPSKKKKIKATFADRIADLNKMLTRMETTEGYAPNEEHLSIKGLRALHTLLHTAQNAAVTAKESEDNQRIERNKCFHDDSGNLLDTGERTRNYLKSVYPPGTPEYKKIVGFKFKPNKYNR